jgi:quercetin dioxygenase-like cupin family protein
MRYTCVLTALVVSLVALPLNAQAPQKDTAAAALGLKEWQPGSNPGVARMQLIGDFTKPELFIARFKYRDGYAIGPHFHNNTVYVTVLSGTFVYAVGDKEDPAAMARMGPGSFLVIEGGQPHFERMEGETVLHVVGVGPFRTTLLPGATRRP